MQTYRRSEAAALSPHIYIAGEIHKFASPGRSPDGVVAAYEAAGYDFLRDMNADSIQKAALRRGIPRGIHLPHEGSFAQMLAFGRGTAVEHLYRFWSALGLPDWGDTGRGPAEVAASEVRALAAATRRAGLWITPTLDCMTSDRPSEPRSVLLRQVVKALQDAGVGLLLAGDDAGDVHDELAALVRAGLTPYQALRTGTYNVAEYFGLLDSAGTVAVGRRADLVLLYDNPLQDIRHAREPAGVMRAGRWFDRAELDQRLLASPKAWFGWTVNSSPGINGSGIGRPYLSRSFSQEQHLKFQKHVKTFEMLTDSLEAAKASERVRPQAVERVLRLLTTELGAIRAVLTPEQYVTFDPIARVWLREHARQGYQMSIAGVSPTP
jgi:hypothetical protein